MTGLGITWAYGRYVFGYRTDLIDAPIKIVQDFWRPSLAGKRGTYVTVNELQMTLFLTSCAVFGKDQYDLKAGYDGDEEAGPDQAQRLHRQHAGSARTWRGRRLQSVGRRDVGDGRTAA